MDKPWSWSERVVNRSISEKDWIIVVPESLSREQNRKKKCEILSIREKSGVKSSADVPWRRPSVGKNKEMRERKRSGV